MSGWQAFWERGGFWRALLLVAAYLALYLGAGRLIGAVAGDGFEDPLSSAMSVFVNLVAPILVGIALLAVFGASLGWLRGLFARQPVGDRNPRARQEGSPHAENLVRKAQVEAGWLNLVGHERGGSLHPAVLGRLLDLAVRKHPVGGHLDSLLGRLPARLRGAFCLAIAPMRRFDLNLRARNKCR